MKKTSIYLDDELDRALASARAEEGLSKAELIRRSLAGCGQPAAAAPSPSIGVFSSGARPICARRRRVPARDRLRRVSGSPRHVASVVALYDAATRPRRRCGELAPRRSTTSSSRRRSRSPRWTISCAARGGPDAAARALATTSTRGAYTVRWWADALAETIAIAAPAPASGLTDASLVALAGTLSHDEHRDARPPPLPDPHDRRRQPFVLLPADAT